MLLEIAKWKLLKNMTHVLIIAIEMIRDSFPNSLSLKVTKILSTKFWNQKTPPLHHLSKGHVTRPGSLSLSLSRHGDRVGEDPGNEVDPHLE